MNNKVKYLLIIAALIVACLPGISQVKDIKETASDDKGSSTPSSDIKGSSDSSSSLADENSFEEDDLAGEIFFEIIKGVGFITYEAQRSVLQNRDRFPNSISLESILDYGTNFSELTFNPSIRFNWGLFASDFRYSLLHDNTGSLESLDWQVLVLRIPIKNLKINYGIGFTSLLDPKNTYFESSTGFDLNLYQNKLNISTNYRWTAKKTKESYRHEFKLTGGYLASKKGLFNLYPMAGLTYQEYFNRDRYLFFNIGLKIRISRD